MRLMKFDGNSVARRWLRAMRSILAGLHRVCARSMRQGPYFTRINPGRHVEGTLFLLPRHGGRVLRPVRITGNGRRSHDGS